MMRTFQYRLRPNAAQVAALEYILADSCETYNAALQERREAWKLQRKSISYYDQTGELAELRQDQRFATVFHQRRVRWNLSKANSRAWS